MSYDWEKKVYFLLNKAARTDSAEEKEAFEKKAYELIHKHGLDMSKINSVKFQSQEIVHREISYMYSQYTPGDWRKYLMACVSSYSGVYGAFSDWAIYFFANESHCNLAIDIYQRWEKELLTRCDAEASKISDQFYSPKNRYGIQRRVWRGHFMYSACLALFARIAEMTTVLDKNTTALVANRYDYFKDQARILMQGQGEFQETEADPNRVVLESAMNAGIRAAKELDIQKKLTGES